MRRSVTIVLALFSTACFEWAMARGMTLDDWLLLHGTLFGFVAFSIALWVLMVEEGEW